MLGGTNITIIGDGFLNSTVVAIGDQHYYAGDNNTSVVSDNTIVVTTQGNFNSSQSVQVYTDGVEVLYDQPYVFNYSVDSTPVVNSISPSVITGASLVTLTGQNFGKSCTRSS